MSRLLRMIRYIYLISALSAVIIPLYSHPISISYSQFAVEGDTVTATLRLPMEELDLLMLLDEDLDGNVATAEIERSRDAIEAYLASRMELSANGVSLSPAIGELRTWDDADGFLFLEVPLAYQASSSIEAISIQVDLLTDLMPGHKNLAHISFGGGSQEFVFERGATYSATATTGGIWQTAKSFLVLGIEHIFTGYDHIMFLFGLLLVGRGLGNLIKIVSSFTVAHSITLALATLNVVQPAAWVTEAGIALSIAYIGFENLFVKEIRHRWKVTFLFGLIHGFGFANILRAMNLPRSGLAVSLFTFNLGVEIGQVAIISLIFPLLVYIARTQYRLTVTRIASTIILSFGLAWFYQRIV
ncbi:MAG: HupE/UreJ family protein [Candidatus Binatia bacterium]